MTGTNRGVGAHADLPLDNRGAAGARNLVVLCDGTSNEVDGDLTNVLKFYRMVERSTRQRVFYEPGVGTMGLARSWGRRRQQLDLLLGLTTGWRIDEKILKGYLFLCSHYSPGDHVYLLGFSRGAYTARAIAGLISVLGLLNPDQVNIGGPALTVYKRASSEDRLDLAYQFRRLVGGQFVPIRFLGLWDTVASVLVPHRGKLLPSMQFLPYTRQNPSVETVRHACAIDERRRLFRLYGWDEGQQFQPHPFQPAIKPQDQRSVWFAGEHSDIGGGHPESESQPAKFPLAWLAAEAELAGLHLDADMARHLILGHSVIGGRRTYAGPDSTARLHPSPQGFWKAFEWIPKNARWRRFPPGASDSGFYVPRSEPRAIAPGSIIHQSVIERRDKTDYAPINLPEAMVVEPFSDRPWLRA